MTPRPTHLVVDAFGTIAHLAHPLRPYAALRQVLQDLGADVQGFALQAMTRPLGLAELAQAYGIEVPVHHMRRLEADLSKELDGLCVSRSAVDCIETLLGSGVSVVIGSNLALPYGLALTKKLSAAGLRVGPLGVPGEVGCAFSYQMGHVKPDRAFYGAIARKAGAGAVFYMVGDKHEEDHAGPRALGWQAAPAKNRSRDDLAWMEVCEHLAPNPRACGAPSP